MLLKNIKHLFKKRKIDTSGNVINIDQSSDVKYNGSSYIKNSTINLNNYSKLVLNDQVVIDGYTITIEQGIVEIGKYSQLISGHQALRPSINIHHGTLIIGEYNVLKCNFLIRFKGVCQIGVYNAINEETEIRCDEKITIGDFNMISYECMIYDTNTHCKYPVEKRREITMTDYPYIGKETEKPSTKEIIIGNDNWFGKRSVVLKGCNIGNSVNIGTNTVVSNIRIHKAIVVGNPGKVINSIES